MARFNLDDYIDVAERIEQFYEKHPGGKITTQLLNVAGWNGQQTQFIVQAFLYDETNQLLATGLAEESLGGSGANLTSALENAETSAIGRATSNLNMVKTRSGARQRATRQEMEKVLRANPGIENVKKALAARFEDANDRKFFVEATIGRTVSGLTELTEDEVTKLTQVLTEGASK